MRDYLPIEHCYGAEAPEGDTKNASQSALSHNGFYTVLAPSFLLIEHIQSRIHAATLFPFKRTQFSQRPKPQV